ncbi:DJ-1/PfpI family protein [Sinomicrobium weinanense]|uniref:DJ-1/PfpI family protein n=1 Tax=Sinomicrobium weinanense TaxID=2842200 RepID=A0A926JV30_9FLAO|nr:DJ-1/PfpI family protein [Sinomicrobium weinanense]MBC9798020.1 DJ-1/PfpI family protein [Sinomicrobium weinanense]MBU3125869.1 DJ-1/PfpI family protein [Sinomicrobium weinanense]
MSQELSKSPVFDGTGYEPSFFSRGEFVAPKTDYKEIDYKNLNTDKNKKVLVVCTEEKYMDMANGKKFATGNHPVETFVPILHLQSAGYEVDFYTINGNPINLELWALPLKDAVVSNVIEKYSEQLARPKSLKEFVAGGFKSESEYVAVFLPGGHGAMLGLPESEDLKKVINWVVAEDKFMLAICHGPAALLAAGYDADPESFPYKGYKINGFPDTIDVTLPEIGYQPGEMPWFYGGKLKNLGVEFLNDDISGACHTDRKLVTGDSPLAANKFGEMCAEALLKDSNANND